MTETMSPEERADLKALATEIGALNWSIDQYGSVTTPDGRTAELNGFASICGYGEAQRASKARARAIVAMTKAFPRLLASLEEAEGRATEWKEQFDTSEAVIRDLTNDLAVSQGRAEKAEQQRDHIKATITDAANFYRDQERGAQDPCVEERTRDAALFRRQAGELIEKRAAALSPSKSEADNHG